MRSNYAWYAMASVLLVVMLIALLPSQEFSPSHKELFLHYAAGLRLPVEEIIDQYEREFGVIIETSAQGSGELVGNILTARQGDLFIAADRGYLDQLVINQSPSDSESLVQQERTIAYQRPVLIVTKENPRGIEELADLWREDVRVSLPDPHTAAIGRVAKRRLGDVLWEKTWQRKQVGRPKVPLVAGDVALGAADAGIAWSATAAQFPQLTSIDLPELAGSRNEIAVAVLTLSHDPHQAAHFAQYLAEHPQARRIWRKYGYDVPTPSLDASPKAADSF